MVSLEKKKKAKILREQNMTYQEIGDFFGVSRGNVFNWLKSLKLKKPRKIYLNKKFPQLKKMYGKGYSRELVRIRDNHTCQKCNRKWLAGERRFDAHHLDGFCGKKSKDYDRIEDLDGLVTLCHKCHMGLESVKKKMRKGVFNFIHSQG